MTQVLLLKPDKNDRKTVNLKPMGLGWQAVFLFSLLPQNIDISKNNYIKEKHLND